MFSVPVITTLNQCVFSYVLTYALDRNDSNSFISYKAYLHEQYSNVYQIFKKQENCKMHAHRISINCLELDKSQIIMHIYAKLQNSLHSETIKNEMLSIMRCFKCKNTKSSNYYHLPHSSKNKTRF